MRAVFFAGTKSASVCSVHNISNIVITVTALPNDKDSFFVHPLRCCSLDLKDDDHVQITRPYQTAHERVHGMVQTKTKGTGAGEPSYAQFGT